MYKFKHKIFVFTITYCEGWMMNLNFETEGLFGDEKTIQNKHKFVSFIKKCLFQRKNKSKIVTFPSRQYSTK